MAHSVDLIKGTKGFTCCMYLHVTEHFSSSAGLALWAYNKEQVSYKYLLNEQLFECTSLRVS